MRRVVSLLALCVLPALCGQDRGGSPSAREASDRLNHGDKLAETMFLPCPLVPSVSVPEETARADEPLHFNYARATLTLLDSAYTPVVKYAPGNTLTVGSRSYELKEVHFHHMARKQEGGPGLIADLVHSDAAGHVAIVGVVMESGQANRAIETAWDHLPREKNLLTEIVGTTIDAGDLLPPSLDYLRFNGSLVRSVCSQDVVWFLLKDPVHISAQQVDRFEQSHPNTRATSQPAHGRRLELPE